MSLLPLPRSLISTLLPHAFTPTNPNTTTTKSTNNSAEAALTHVKTIYKACVMIGASPESRFGAVVLFWRWWYCFYLPNYSSSVNSSVTSTDNDRISPGVTSMASIYLSCKVNEDMRRARDVVNVGVMLGCFGVGVTSEGYDCDDDEDEEKSVLKKSNEGSNKKPKISNKTTNTNANTTTNNTTLLVPFPPKLTPTYTTLKSTILKAETHLLLLTLYNPIPGGLGGGSGIYRVICGVVMGGDVEACFDDCEYEGGGGGGRVRWKDVEDGIMREAWKAANDLMFLPVVLVGVVIEGVEYGDDEADPKADPNSSVKSWTVQDIASACVIMGTRVTFGLLHAKVNVNEGESELLKGVERRFVDRLFEDADGGVDYEVKCKVEFVQGVIERARERERM